MSALPFRVTVVLRLWNSDYGCLAHIADSRGVKVADVISDVIVKEISGSRKNLPSDKLPWLKLPDTVTIRILTLHEWKLLNAKKAEKTEITINRIRNVLRKNGLKSAERTKQHERH